MFDKITIRATVSDEEAAHLSRLHSLYMMVSGGGEIAGYRSNMRISNITGVVASIQREKCKLQLTLKMSLHKFWNYRTRGVLRNDDDFTVSEAKSAIGMLLFENGLLSPRTRIIQFEIGLNMEVSFDPLDFIEKAQYISSNEKLMFVDANFIINRQRTTEKNKNMRKYYKIYDKGFERISKLRGKKREAAKEAEERHILRIETVYRRHNESVDTFFSDANIKRLSIQFYKDWSGLFFFRSVDADKGTRKSEIERATAIINSSGHEYLQRVKNDFERGKITQKQFRTIREFVRDFELNKGRFRTVISKQEKQYAELLNRNYNICSV
ncbi:MAG: hypothetical protein LBH18_03825 [Spirochaetaceae bacterium]|nr:hypothetical protein [Spirochaetaceae bacterium]